MIPEVIYKYEACSVQSLANLKNQVVYFGAPSNFNDPYDCALDPKIRLPEDEGLAELRKSLLNADDVPPHIREELEAIDNRRLKEILLDRSRQILQKHAADFLNRRGVACFSEVNDNLLMWSHYADRYRGFCLGFRTSFDPFSGIQRVQYSDKMPELDVVSPFIDNDFSQLLSLFLTKSIDWSYEREWRCMHDRAGTEFCYESEALEGVYFGPEMKQEFIEIICLILQGQNSHVRFWKGERDRDKFKVNFKEFDYIRAIDASERPQT